jgi:hypothetical protein
MAETTVLRSSAINRTPNGGAKPQAQLSGAHPVVQVNMNAGGPKIQGGAQVRQGVTILPPKGGTRTFTTGGLPNQGAKPGVVIMPTQAQLAAAAAAPPPSPLTADQLLLCRHLTDKYLDTLRESTSETAVDGAAADNIALAEGTIKAIDNTMAAMTAAAAAAAAAATAAAAAPPQRAAHVGARQVAAGAGPRRVARPAGPPPPPVVVQMDAERPVLVTDAIDATSTDSATQG